MQTILTGCNYVVINDNLQDCFNQICNLIDSEIHNSSYDYDKELIQKHVNKLTS